MKKIWIQTTRVNTCNDQQDCLGGWLKSIRFTADGVEFTREPCFRWNYQSNLWVVLSDDDERILGVLESAKSIERALLLSALQWLEATQTSSVVEFATSFANIVGACQAVEICTEIPAAPVSVSPS
jgi:hypothetical protein